MDVDNFISDHLYVKKENWKETTQTATSMKKREELPKSTVPVISTGSSNSQSP